LEVNEIIMTNKKKKDKRKDWEERFDNAFAMGEWFFNGNAGDDYSEFLVWCKKLIRKEIKQQKQELREKIEKMKIKGVGQFPTDYNEALSDIQQLLKGI
jgi:hypothetical protein